VRQTSVARWITCVSLFLVTALFPAVSRAACEMPRYYVVRDFVGPQHEKGALQLWVRPQEFRLDHLICLVQTLDAQHPEWRDVTLLLFSSEEAAEKFEPGGMSIFRNIIDATGKIVAVEDVGRFKRELRGLYVLKASTHERYLSITPLGLEGGEAFDTKIEFPLTSQPHCRHEVDYRCLFGLEPFVYPKAALIAKMSGSVTVRGVIARDGTVKATIVTTSQASANDPLAKAALQNLSTWWFERADKPDSFEITYSFVIDPTLEGQHANDTLGDKLRVRELGYSSVQLSLPGSVRISGYLPE